MFLNRGGIFLMRGGFLFLIHNPPLFLFLLYCYYSYIYYKIRRKKKKKGVVGVEGVTNFQLCDTNLFLKNNNCCKKMQHQKKKEKYGSEFQNYPPLHPFHP